MHIFSLEVENLKRVSFVRVEPDPDDHLVVVAGRNEQGKSSTLDAIMYALAGGRSIPEQPIKNGAKKGRVALEIGGPDGISYLVEKKFSQGQSPTLVVTQGQGGAKINSPQKLLDGLVGQISFDPCAFLREDGKKQLEILKRLVGLDFTDLDTERKRLYDLRTGVNHRINHDEQNLKGVDACADAPDAKVSAQDILAELDLIADQNADREKMVNEQTAVLIKISDKGKRINDLDQEVGRTKNEIERLTERLKDLERESVGARIDLDRIGKDADKLAKELVSTPVHDPAPIRAKLDQVESINTRVDAKKRYKALAASLDGLRTNAESLTKEIAAVDQRKRDLVAAAELPVEGLELDDEGVYLDGIPLEQLSQAQGIQVSVAVGCAMNPKLKVLLIRDGSLLDDAHRLLVAEIAERYDCQVWIEMAMRNDDDDVGATVVIEDGRVRED